MKKIILLSIIMAFIILNTVYAVYEAGPVLTTDTGGGGACDGYVIYVNKNLTLDYAVFHNGSANHTSVNIYLTNANVSSQTSLINISYTGNNQSINYNLTAENYYVIVSYATAMTHNYYGTTPGFTVNKTNIAYVFGTSNYPSCNFSDVNHGTTYSRVFDGFGTTESGAFTTSLNYNANTTSNGTYYNLSQNWFYTSINIKNFPAHNNSTINLYNTTNLINSQTTSSALNLSYNFTSLPPGTYYLNATARNGTNILNSTIRMINIYSFSNNITSPANNTAITRYLNLSYTSTFNPSGVTVISSSNISLLNNDYTLNTTINTSTNTTPYVYDTFQTNLSTGTYKLLVISKDNNTNTVNKSLNINITRNMRLNVTAYDSLTNTSITNFSINFFDLTTGGNETFTTTTGLLQADLIRNRAYNISVDAGELFAIINQSITTNSTPYQTLNLTLQKTNSVTIYIRDSGSGTLINATTNVTLTSNGSSYSYNTTSGVLFVYNITKGYYEFKFEATNYGINTYFLTITNRSTQTLNAYLTATATDVILTFKDDSSGALLEGLSLQVSRIINGSWTIVDTKFTDITGRTKFNLLFTTNYRFSASFIGYDDKVFNLNPVLFTSYDVFMTKQAGTNPNEMDYSDISIQWLPLFLSGNSTNNFTWEIRSPSGKLVSYFYNLTYPCGNQSFNGVSATGDLSLKTFNITCSNVSSTATLFYSYTTSLGETKTYLASIGISDLAQNYTFIKNNDSSYGMGTFERVLVVMIFVIVFTGVASMLGGLAFGTLLGMLIMVFFMIQGFFPVWAGIIPLIIGFFIIKESTGR